MENFRDALTALYLELFNDDYSLALRQAMADITAWQRDRRGWSEFAAEILAAAHFAP